VKKATILPIALLIGTLLATFMPTLVSAHITGGETKISGKYRIQFLVLPKNPLPNENVTLNFSIQDLASNNLSNVTATIMIELANATVFSAPMKNIRVRRLPPDVYFSSGRRIRANGHCI